MRLVFMGTPEFAARILEQLIPEHDIVGVYTRPDAVRSRGKKLVPSPVKELATGAGIAVFTPQTLRTPEALEELRALNPDIICVAAYGAILPQEVLDIPRYGCLNVHASLLPRWRGAAPIERAILEGDDMVGVCIMRMEEGLDTGDYCVSRSIPSDDKNADELTAELADLGAQALLTALVHVEEEHPAWVSQDESRVTYAHKIEKGELDLDPALSAQINARRVRASGKAHPSHAVIADKRVTVVQAQLAGDAAPLQAGEVAFIAKRLLLGCADGVLEIIRIKPDGKKEMDARSFAAGIPAIREGKASWNHA